MLRKNLSRLFSLQGDTVHLPGKLHYLLFPLFLMIAFAVCVPKARSQTLQLVPATTPVFPTTPVGATTQQNILLQVTGAPISITSFSFANSIGGNAEYVVGTVTGCTVDGSTLNPVGTTCTVPVTFQPAFPSQRQEPLKVVISSGTFYFGVSGMGQSALAALTPGTLTTAAGPETTGNSGNNFPATGAPLSGPSRAVVDYQGNIFISDTGNNAVREALASNGNIILVVGTGTPCSSPAAACGDGGAATNANLLNPTSVAIDATGNLFIADSGDNRIRRVDASTGIITTVAGNGGSTYTGDGGQATATSIGNPQQVIVDTARNLYIAAAGDNAVHYVAATTGIISTLAGNGTPCPVSTAPCGDGGAAAGGSSQLNAPTGLARDATGNLYIADQGDNRVRRVDAMTGTITTVAGTGIAGDSGNSGSAITAELNAVHGVDLDPAGDLYLSDQGNAAVRLVLAYTGTIQTIAGNGTPCPAATAPCGENLVSTTDSLISPQSSALDSYGNLYIADSVENRIRKVYVVQPTFTFNTTMVGFPSSSNSEAVLLTNIGNQLLEATVPTSGTNPTFTPGFSYDSGTSGCPLIPSSSPPVLPSGDGCTYGIDFTPTSVGMITGMMTLSGNSYNNPSATQSVLLIGNATPISEANQLSSSNISPAYGAAVTFTDTFTVVDNIPPTGTVSFFNGSTFLGSTAVNPSGVETFTLTWLPAGTDNITASYSGDTNYAAENSNTVFETVGNSATLATTTTLTSSVNPSNYSQSTIFTATIGSSNNGTPPSGSVTFYSPGSASVINLQAAAGSTTLSETLNLAVGTYSLSILGNANGGVYNAWNPSANPSTNNLWTDRYGIELCGTCTSFVNDLSGDPGYNRDALALQSFQAATTLNMTVDATVQGQTVNNPYTFTLGSPQSVSFYIPDGSFTNGAFTNISSFANATGGLSLSLTPLTALGTAAVDSSGAATYSTTMLPIGTDAIEAIYSGDSTYIASSSAVFNQIVYRASTTGMLTSSNLTPAVGQSVTFTDTIPSANGTNPTGTVTFYNGTTSLGTGTLTSGVATLTTTALPVGADTITASYSGNSTFQPATSNNIVETVGKYADSGTLTVAPASSTFGQSVTFSDSIALVTGIPPTGTVTFYNGATSIGTVAITSSGGAMLMTVSLPAGTDNITAVYSGDSNYLSTSNAVMETVSKAGGSDALIASTLNAVAGQQVTLTDTLPIVAGIAPTGTVTFYTGTSAIGISSINTSGAATLTTASLPVGSDVITAVYAGDNNYLSATAGPLTIAVAPLLATTDILSVSTSTSTFGQSVTLTDTISKSSTTIPTGTVTFYDGGIAIGTNPVSVIGVATFTISTLSVGSHSITAIYSGDATYLTEASNSVSLTVIQGDFIIAVSPATQTINSGQSVSYVVSLQGSSAPFDETVTLSASGLPTGATVNFTPASLTPGAGPITSTMTIATLPTQAPASHSKTFYAIGYVLLLLPFSRLKKFRSRLHSQSKSAALLLVIFIATTSMAAIATLTGCGSGYFVVPHQSTITVVGTSGTLQHVTTVTLIVEQRDQD